MAQLPGAFDERSVRVTAQRESREVEPRVGRAVCSDRAPDSQTLEGMRDLDIDQVRCVELVASHNALVKCWIDRRE